MDKINLKKTGAPTHDLSGAQKCEVRGYYTDDHGIIHYAPNWDISMLKFAYSKYDAIQKKFEFQKFCSVVKIATNRFYFVFMCCYPKLSNEKLFDMILHEVCE